MMDEIIGVLRTPEEQKKYEFCEAYTAWVNAENQLARDVYWERYLNARQAYLGLGFNRRLADSF